MKKKPLNKSNEKIFIITFAALFAACILTRIVLHIIHQDKLGDNLFFTDKKDYFMDFFNPLFFSSRSNPYDIKDLGAIYPPICYLFYKFILLFVPSSEIVDRFAIRENRMLLMIMMIITILTVLFTTVLLQNNLSLSKHKKNAVVFCVILSFPVLYLIERANILFLCFVLLLFFVCYHDADSRILSELSLIALAVAASIKIYPAVFGILLFYEKKVDPKKIFRCVVYGVLAFFLPFLAFGPSSLFDFLNNLTSGIQDTESHRSPFTCLDVRAFFGSVNKLLFHNNLQVETLSVLFIAFMLLMTVLHFILTKNMFRKTLDLTVATLLIPSIVYTYGAVMLIIPLLFWLNETPRAEPYVLNETRYGRLYGVLLTLIMAPVPILSNNLKSLLLIMLLYVAITVETVLLAARKIKSRSLRSAPHSQAE